MFNLSISLKISGQHIISRFLDTSKSVKAIVFWKIKIFKLKMYLIKWLKLIKIFLNLTYNALNISMMVL